jgi:hypothetical protein
LLTWAFNSYGEIQLSSAIDLEDAGLRIKPLADAQQIPLPPPGSINVEYTNPHTGQREMGERYNPDALWAMDQFIGRWQTHDGYSLVLAEARYSRVKHKKDELVKLDDYTQSTRKLLGKRMSDSELLHWASDVVGAPLRGNPTDMDGSYRVLKIRQLHFHSPAQNVLAYLFQVRQSGHASWFLALIGVPPSEDLGRVEAKIESQFLPNIAPIRRKSSRTSLYSNQIASSTVSDHNTSSAESNRKRASASLQNMNDWWKDETKHYIIVSDLKNQGLANKIKTDIELLRRQFEEMVQPRTHITAVSVVRVFADRAAYANYVGQGYGWTAGLWVPNRKELVISSSDWGESSEKRKALLQVIYHEAFHQYLHYAYDGLETSIWFNEGMAEFFEQADLSSSTFNISESDKNAKVIDALVQADALQFDNLLRLSHRQFYSGTNYTVKVNYATAWALCYFLQKGIAQDKHSRYRLIMPTYVRTLWKTKDHVKATREAFNDIDMDILEADFKAFWQDQEKRNSADKRADFSGMSY